VEMRPTWVLSCALFSRQGLVQPSATKNLDLPGSPVDKNRARAPDGIDIVVSTPLCAAATWSPAPTPTRCTPPKCGAALQREDSRSRRNWSSAYSALMVSRPQNTRVHICVKPWEKLPAVTVSRHCVRGIVDLPCGGTRCAMRSGRGSGLHPGQGNGEPDR